MTYEAYLSPAPYNFLDHYSLLISTTTRPQILSRFNRLLDSYNPIIGFSIILNHYQHRQNPARGRPARVACYLLSASLITNPCLTSIAHSTYEHNPTEQS